MSSTPQPSPNPVDAAKAAATDSVAELKKTALKQLEAERGELATAQQELAAAISKRNTAQRRVESLKLTIASFDKITTGISKAKVRDPNAVETCVL